MKLQELIDSLSGIAASNPDAEARFQNVDVASAWFEPTRCEFLDARTVTLKDCVVTFGPEAWVASDYKKFADKRRLQEE